jgi:hypothetical protein
VTYTEPGQWLRMWLGALTAGFVVFFAFTFTVLSTLGRREQSSLVAAVVLVAVIVGIAALSMVKERRDFAIGVLVGYALLSLISSGQCTLLASDIGGRGMQRGLVGYPILLGASGVIGVILFSIRRRRIEDEEEEER